MREKRRKEGINESFWTGFWDKMREKRRKERRIPDLEMDDRCNERRVAKKLLSLSLASPSSQKLKKKRRKRGGMREMTQRRRDLRMESETLGFFWVTKEILREKEGYYRPIKKIQNLINVPRQLWLICKKCGYFL